MKMTKNKIYGGFAVVTAALLVFAVFSCSGPAGGGKTQDNYKPAPGMGYVVVNVPFSPERTILPSAGTWTSYTLTIQRYDLAVGGTALGTPTSSNIATGALINPIDLAPGYYEVTVAAFLNSGTATTDLGAQGTSARFQITAGLGQNVLVPIRPLPYTATLDGTFSYSLQFINSGGGAIPNPASRKITITPVVSGNTWNGGDGGTSNTLTLTTNTPPPISLTPGIYNVLVEVSVGQPTNSSSVYELVHIHQNLTSGPVAFVYDADGFQGFISSISAPFTPLDVKPELEDSSNAVVGDGSTVTVSKDDIVSAAGEEIITVTNESEFDSIAWYSGSATPIKTGDVLTIDDTFLLATFPNEKTYQVTVVGYTGTAPNYTAAYSTKFKVKVDP